jgi:hypothetical protein
MGPAFAGTTVYGILEVVLVSRQADDLHGLRRSRCARPSHVPGDEPVGDVVEVVADTLRLRTDS